MTTHVRVDVGQARPRRDWWGRALAAARGVWAVIVMLVTAVDALITAVIGVPPLAWLGRQIGRELAAEYRRGRENAVDVEIVDDPCCIPGDREETR